MEYRTLKGTDLKMSAIAFGTIAFANVKRGPEQLAAGKSALRLALDSGVNTIHSSYEYGTRQAAREILRERKATKKVMHIIKVPVPDRNGGHPEWDPRRMVKLVDDALGEMDADRIDLLQWIQRDGTENDPEKSAANFSRIKDDVKAAFDKLRDAGKAGYLGCFAYQNVFAAAAARSGIFSAMLFYYNMYDTTLLPSFDLFRERGLGIIPFRPFQGGLLVDKRADTARIPAEDRYVRERWLQKGLVRRDEMFAQMGRKISNLTQYAIKFTLACDLTGTVITGLNTREQVRETLAAVDGDYPRPDPGPEFYAAAKAAGGPWSM